MNNTDIKKSFDGEVGKFLVKSSERINLEMFITMLHLMNEGINVVDNSGIIIFMNKKAARLFNVDNEKMVGKHLFETFPCLNEKTSTIFKVLKNKRPLVNYRQTVINYKGDKITTINTTYPVVIRNKVAGAFEIIRDIPTLNETFKKCFSIKTLTSKSNVFYSNRSYYNFDDIVGRNPVLIKTIETAKKIANTRTPIWIYGETGTGKELLVQSIHNYSGRCEKPFVAQNCSAIPESLLESILFGTAKGSFTGAVEKPGIFEVADGGMLFLDEIQYMTKSLQSKLLRVLQENLFRRIGDHTQIHTDIKVMVGSNISPKETLKQGIIREDLYYRLCVIVLRIPPLRERKDDIPLLARHFINKYNSELGLNVKDISKKVLDIFMEYDWPGNIRQLENIIESAMNVMEGNIICIDHLPYEFSELKGNEQKNNDSILLGLRDTVESVEKGLILEAIEKAQGNITEASKVLGIPRQTLHYKLKVLGINYKD